MSVHSNILAIERDIERIKLLHQMKRVTHDAAKTEIRRLEKQLLEHVNQLPAHEKQIFLLRKEFGKDF
ncbi:MAG: hypothetical protein WC613_03575 [Candidatus Aenigmatarchaeota archaeon]